MVTCLDVLLDTLKIIKFTYYYVQTLLYYWILSGQFKDCPYFKNSLHTRVHLFSLALNIKIWGKPHYRNGTYQEDLLKNLRNVAIPGTGIALSKFCHNRVTAIFFILVINPIICLFSAIIQYRTYKQIVNGYLEQLLTPDDWFSYWRINCILASYHSMHTHAPGYAMEDKWAFLIKAKENGIAVSPWLEVPNIVVKNVNEEGGLGIHFFKNATVGGQYIIQEVLENGPFIANLLPNNAPLSTFRVITASKYSLLINKEVANENCIEVLSTVFRAGRAGASTDHQSILFDVDKETGFIKAGTTNAHWYKLGMKNFLRAPYTSSHDYFRHPDTDHVLSETQIPEFESIINIARSAHFHLMPDVPLGGWDVAVTTTGVLLLEVNLSCNFFRGSFDREKYFAIVGEYYSSI